MNIDELLNSYDPIDLRYEARFQSPDSLYLGDEDRGGYVYTSREMVSSYMSFIPNKEEAEEILMGPLRRLLS